MSVHAVITNSENKILQLKQTHGDLRWGLPGGAIEPGETVHEALVRECKEELGVDIKTRELTGIYYHKSYESQVVIIRCTLPESADFWADEKSEYIL